MSSFRRTWQEDLQQNKVESLTVLAGGLAHDLNNSLAVIQGFLSLTRVQLDQRFALWPVSTRPPRPPDVPPV